MELRKLLNKLGVQSAKVSFIEEAMERFEGQWGIPDKIYMSPDSFNQIQKMIKEDDEDSIVDDDGGNPSKPA